MGATSGFKEVFRRHEVLLTLEKYLYLPKLDRLADNSVPKVEEKNIEKGGKRLVNYAYEEGAPNPSAMFLYRFKNLSFQLGKQMAKNGLLLSQNGDVFELIGVENDMGETALEFSEELLEHALLTVGVARNNKNESFIIAWKQRKSDKMVADYEKNKFFSAVMERLAELHNEGFACGGLKVDDAEMVGGKAKVKDASRIFAMNGSDSVFYEVAFTLHSFKAAGATSKDLIGLAREYLSASVVGRDAANSHLREKKLKGKPYEELAKAAERFGLYFPQKEVA